MNTKLIPVITAFFLLFSAGFVPRCFAQLQQEKSPHTEKVEEHPDNTDTESKPWYHSSRDYVVHHADNIAQWTDTFFGDKRTEQEAAYSTLRLRLKHSWNEDDDFDSDLGLRGKLHLPRINKRLSLLFSDDEQTSDDDLIADDRDSSDDIALQYRAREKKYYRIDLKAGLRSSGNPKGAVRYRYERPIEDTLIGRFSSELYYRGGDGLGHRARLEFDKILDSDKVFQWHNKVNWEEEESGVSWVTGFALKKRLTEKKAVSYYVSANGSTQPDGLTNSYGLGIRYRQNLFQPWIFADIQPGYRWVKQDQHDDRHGVASLVLRLEVVFEKDFSQ
ncbi:MAG: hypothetical protein R3E73_14045 [Porticoccaceae bacterium]|nr:hypothetical protein [Pseudomonadales bacterium]MCP5170881.1 hypothetical protein [Pseudomonadales bacterium]